MGSAKVVMVDDASRPLLQHQLYKGRQPKARTSATARRKPKQGRQPQQGCLLQQRCGKKRTPATARTSAAAGRKPKHGRQPQQWRLLQHGHQPQQGRLLQQKCQTKRTPTTARTSAAAGCKPQSTYICRVKSCVWRLPKYWPTSPSPPSESSASSPRTKGGGVHTRRAVRGWGVNILKDARHWIGLWQYNLSTVQVKAWTPAERDVGHSMDASNSRDTSHCKHFSNRKYGSR